MTLHIINKPPSRSALRSCIEAASPGDGIVLLEHGVYCATRAAGQDFSDQLNVHALAPDVDARGLRSRVVGSIEVITDAQFVDLVCQHNPIVTWS